jgi:hypothetical protein
MTRIHETAMPPKESAQEAKSKADAAIALLDPYFEKEEMSIWESSDLLVELNLSSKPMDIVARHFGRTVGTLRAREQVAKEYPDDPNDPNHRNYAVPFGVHQRLLGVTDYTERARLLNRPEGWTVTDAMNVATEWKKTQESYKKRQRSRPGVNTPQGMKITSSDGDIYIRGEITPSGKLKLTISAPITGATTSFDEDEARTYYELAVSEETLDIANEQ